MYYWYFIFLVGAPIKVKKTQSPSPEEIDKIHQQYITALEELFEKHKKNYGICENKHLQICWVKFFIIILNDYVLKVSKFWGLQFYKCKNQWSTSVILYSYSHKIFFIYSKSFHDQTGSVKMVGCQCHSLFFLSKDLLFIWVKKTTNIQSSWLYVWSITHVYCSICFTIMCEQ